MRTVLVAWLGKTDLRAPTESEAVGAGPVVQAIQDRGFSEVVLLSEYTDGAIGPYLIWLRSRTTARIAVVHERLGSPAPFARIYDAAVRGVQRAIGNSQREVALTFHLTPGTPAMAAIWILLGKTRFPAELIESSREDGVRTVSMPFDIPADFIPDLLREQDARLRQASVGEPADAPAFADIVHGSRVMGRLVQRARRVAVRNVPVLIEGESGTGKEMLARAIHGASPRRDQPFVPVNCGALPTAFAESELFGHERGAFAGATEPRKGHLEAADRGTLFLDELGELPAAAQVGLLRVIQDGEVVRLGAIRPIKIDVRIIAATNRPLTQDIADGRFREQLFYRLAVAVLKVPPLRERTGDIALLIDRLWQRVNREAASEPGYQEKKLSAGARNSLIGCAWPGNVRELFNTLRGAAIWSEGAAVSSEDVREALLSAVVPDGQDVLRKPLGGGFRLQDLLKDVASSYLRRAMDEAHGSKTKAAELVGLPSYQTLTNWLSRYEIRD